MEQTRPPGRTETHRCDGRPPLRRGFSIIPLMHPWQGDGDGKKPVVGLKKFQTRRPLPATRLTAGSGGKHLHKRRRGVPISNLGVVDIDSVEARREVIKADWPDPW